MAYASTHREQSQPELEHQVADARLLTEEKSLDGDTAAKDQGADQDKMIIIDRGSSSDEPITIGPRSRGDSLE